MDLWPQDMLVTATGSDGRRTLQLGDDRRGAHAPAAAVTCKCFIRLLHFPARLTSSRRLKQHDACFCDA